MMRFERQAMLGDGAFGEAGRPTGVYWDQYAGRLAVASTFGSLQWHARDVPARRSLEYRVGVYDAHTTRLIATFDHARFPINDVAFHPTQPLLAIASGSYDGGYFYEGDLFVWDVETGEVRSILDENREVTRCRFDDGGEALHVTLRPCADTEGDNLFLEGLLDHDAWQIKRSRSVSLRHLDLTPFKAIGGREGYSRQDEQATWNTLRQLARRAGLHYEPRWSVWDLAWTPGGEIIAVRNNTAFEQWAATGERLQHMPAPLDGVQLVLDPTGAAYVNLSGVYFDGRWRLETRVERIEVATGRRTILSAVDFAALLSLSSSGALLARNTGTDRLYSRQRQSDERSRDRILIPEADPPWFSRATSRVDGLTVSESLDLGPYGLFNDYPQIDGAPHLYFVQGMGDSHESRWICRIDPYSLRVERLFPLAWDLNRGADVHIGGGLYVNDGIGPALIMSYQRFDTRRRPIGAASIVRRRLDDGRTLWAADFDGTVTAMAAMPKRNVVAFALDDGHVGSVSADTGDVRGLQSADLNGVPIMYLALAARGDCIAAGTIDGRIVISKLVE